MVFTTLTLSQMAHVMAIRSERLSLFRLGLLSNKTVAGRRDSDRHSSTWICVPNRIPDSTINAEAQTLSFTFRHHPVSSSHDTRTPPPGHMRGPTLSETNEKATTMRISPSHRALPTERRKLRIFYCFPILSQVWCAQIPTTWMGKFREPRPFPRRPSAQEVRLRASHRSGEPHQIDPGAVRENSGWHAPIAANR